MIELPKTFIGNYFIALDKSTYAQAKKRITGKLMLVGKAFPAKAIVSIPELKVRKELEVKPDGTCEFAIEATGMKLWSPESPKLYTVTIGAGEDTVSDEIGFRSIETRGKQIVLNGKPIFLKGISLHDENPLRKDRANSEADAALVLGWAKELGCNFIRLAHYPHQENIVRMIQF